MTAKRRAYLQRQRIPSETIVTLSPCDAKTEVEQSPRKFCLGGLLTENRMCEESNGICIKIVEDVRGCKIEAS